MDVSQIVKSSVAALARENATIEPGLIRHTALNSIRAIRLKHAAQYGELVICADSMSNERRNWRKDAFPYYKARRQLRYDDSAIDWASAQEIINSVFCELRDHFPYRFISVSGAEADDVIGVICHDLGVVEDTFPATAEQLLIVSSDRDFIQLQKFANVSQYNNITDSFMRVDDAVTYLHEKILTGDAGDDVPNVRTADDHFMGENGRQKPITAGIKKDFDAYKETDPFAESRYMRNKVMIDLSHTPDYLKDEIRAQFAVKPELIRRSRIMTYLATHRLRDLVKYANDF